MAMAPPKVKVAVSPMARWKPKAKALLPPCMPTPTAKRLVVLMPAALALICDMADCMAPLLLMRASVYSKRSQTSTWKALNSVRRAPTWVLV